MCYEIKSDDSNAPFQQPKEKSYPFEAGTCASFFTRPVMLTDDAHADLKLR